MDRLRESSAPIGNVLGAAFLTMGIATGTFAITAPGIISLAKGFATLKKP